MQPITVAVTIDTSGRMSGRVVPIADATERFIDALEPGDRARIGTFGER